METVKSGITETTATVMVSAASIIFLQYMQGGMENISDSAITALVIAIIPFVLRLIHKRRINA